MQTLIRTNYWATRAGTLHQLDHGALDAMEPPAAKKLAAGARKPASLAAGAASKPAAASLAATAHKPKAKPQKVRGDLSVIVAARAVQQHLEKFQRPFTAAQLWENTQKVVAKKEIVAVRAQRPGRARRWRAVEQFRDGITPRRPARASPRRATSPSRNFNQARCSCTTPSPTPWRASTAPSRRPRRSATSSSTSCRRRSATRRGAVRKSSRRRVDGVEGDAI